MINFYIGIIENTLSKNDLTEEQKEEFEYQLNELRKRKKELDDS